MSGLTELDEEQIFAGMKLSFSGEDPDISVTAENISSDPDLSRIAYAVSPSSNLAAGDALEVQATIPAQNGEAETIASKSFTTLESVEAAAAKYLNAVLDFDYEKICFYTVPPCDKVFEKTLENQAHAASSKEKKSASAQSQLKRIQEMADKAFMQDFFQQVGTLVEKWRADTYGDTHKREIEITSITAMTESEKSDALKEFSNKFSMDFFGNSLDLQISDYIDLNRVEGMCKVVCRVSETGIKDAETFRASFTFICIDGQYKVLESGFFPLHDVYSIWKSDKGIQNIDVSTLGDLGKTMFY